MKVSMIIPIYKVESYLRPCLESVLAQSFQDYEVILVDDGSPDGCGAICDEYAAAYENIHVVHKKNGGLSSARNAGLDIARGQYVYFLDSDDTVEPQLLQRLVELMDQGLDLVGFRYNILKADGTRQPGREIQLGSFYLPDQEHRLSFIRDTLVSCAIGWEAWSRIFVREKIEKYGLRFADNREIFAEDLYFSMCYCAHAEKLLCIDDCLYNYRVREDSIMGVQQARSNLGRICTLADAVLSYYRQFSDCSLLTESFSQIYYHLIAGQFTYQMWASGIKPAAYRRLVRQEVRDWNGMEKQLRAYLSGSRAKKTMQERELRAHVLFLLGGSELALRLRCKMLRMQKERL